MTIAADENVSAPGQHRRNASVTADTLSLLWERVIAGGTPLCATTVRKLVNAVPIRGEHLTRFRPRGQLVSYSWQESRSPKEHRGSGDDASKDLGARIGERGEPSHYETQSQEA